MHVRMFSSLAVRLAVLLSAATLLSDLSATDLSEDPIAAAKCNDPERPFKCHHYASCYGFQQYCTDDVNIRGVAECFPKAWNRSERYDFCHKWKEGTRSLVNDQCLYACEDAFPTSKWNSVAHSEDVCTEDKPHYCPSSKTCYGFESFCSQTVQSCFPPDRITLKEIQEWCDKNGDSPLHPSCKFACQNEFGNTTSEVSGALSIDDCTDDKPHYCSSSKTCYGFQSFCNETVQSCFPAEKITDDEIREWCERNGDSPLHPSCRFACKNKFENTASESAHSEDVCTKEKPHYCSSNKTCYGFESFCDQTVKSCFPANMTLYEEIHEWCEKNGRLPVHPSCRYACQSKLGNIASEGPSESSDKGLMIAILVVVIVIFVAGSVAVGVYCYCKGYCNRVCRRTHHPVPREDPNAQNKSDGIVLRGGRNAPGHVDTQSDRDVHNLPV